MSFSEGALLRRMYNRHKRLNSLFARVFCSVRGLRVIASELVGEGAGEDARERTSEELAAWAIVWRGRGRGYATRPVSHPSARELYKPLVGERIIMGGVASTPPRNLRTICRVLSFWML